jgi:hypothetical protein
MDLKPPHLVIALRNANRDFDVPLHIDNETLHKSTPSWWILMSIHTFFERNIQQGRPPLWILLKRNETQHCTKETLQEKRRAKQALGRQKS